MMGLTMETCSTQIWISLVPIFFSLLLPISCLTDSWPPIYIKINKVCRISTQIYLGSYRSLDMNFPTTFLVVLSSLCFDAFEMVDMLMTKLLPQHTDILLPA
jgi:hypothetical protein